MKIIQIRPATAADKSLKRLYGEELKRLFSGKNVRVMTPDKLKASEVSRKKAQEAEIAAFRKLFAPQQDFVNAIVMGAASVADDSLGAAEPQKGGINGQARLRGLVRAHQYFNSVEEQRKTYVVLHGHAVKALSNVKDVRPKREAMAALGRLVEPGGIGQLSLQDVLAAIAALLNWILQFLASLMGQMMPAGRPATCSEEEGTGDGTDQTGCIDIALTGGNPKGLRAAASWPLRFFTTCVRAQRNRGTCTAFAVVAAAEAYLAFHFQRWMNLSEQDLYKHERLDWYPPLLGAFVGDGYVDVVSMMVAATMQYVFPLERDWDYNPSLSRIQHVGAFTDSCVAYSGGDCSDTAHQAKVAWALVTRTELVSVVSTTCSAIQSIPWLGNVLSEWVCEPVTNWVSQNVNEYVVAGFDTNVPGTSGFKLTSFSVVWVHGVGNFTSAKAHLALGLPVCLEILVPPSFTGEDIQNGKGYVPFSQTEFIMLISQGKIASLGGHSVMLSGYVDNTNLPAGVAPGDGGGYFIMKNSWRTQYGDAGFGYLPYAWVQVWGLTMTSVTGMAAV